MNKFFNYFKQTMNISCESKSITNYCCWATIKIPKWKIDFQKHFCFRFNNKIYLGLANDCLNKKGWKVCGIENHRLGTFCWFCTNTFERQYCE